MNTRFCLPLLALATFAACQTTSYTSPGIQPAEARIMEKHFDWEPSKDPHSFTDAEVRALFAQSQRSNLTAAQSDEQSARLKWALAAVGDQHFATLLSRESPDTRQATLLSLSSLWEDHNLRYPQTERLLMQIVN